MSVPSETTAGSERPERDSEEFATQVRGMFDRIAGVYDLMNSAMTAGLHHQWRERAVDRAEVGPGSDALDICCGTGDLALALRRRIGPDGRVVGCDFSEPMLELARQKSGEEGLAVEFGWADALDLPYGDRELRRGHGRLRRPQPRRPRQGLAEMARVLRPGGRLVILEITRPQREPLSSFYSLWFDRLVPVLGAVAGDQDAYSYLPESVRSFPEPEALAAKIERAGLRRDPLAAAGRRDHRDPQRRPGAR